MRRLLPNGYHVEGGTLHYSVAGYNGHLWGQCTTVGCARWME